MSKYIYQYKQWPDFTWNEKQIGNILGKVRHLQGKIFGQMNNIGFTLKEESYLSTLTLDVLKTSEIEGAILNYDQVRSSIAQKLGIETSDTVHVGRDVEGIVEMMLDATRNYDNIITNERLFSWYASLFPTGYSGMHKIEIGSYRKGEMQVVSGPMGKERIHFQAPHHDKVQKEMNALLDWINNEEDIDLVIKSAIVHFWFIIIHPFDDGNGRIARALTDLLLAKSEQSSLRFYSLSNQILTEKKTYYAILQKVQHSSGDITEWLEWFLNCLYRSLQSTNNTMEKVFYKTYFWEQHQETELNNRQRIMLNKLLDGFEGKLKTSKWAKITKTSTDTALRDIKDLISKGILNQESSGGRSTNYELVKKPGAKTI